VIACCHARLFLLTPARSKVDVPNLVTSTLLVDTYFISGMWLSVAPKMDTSLSICV
jgi:hypothetical protein